MKNLKIVFASLLLAVMGVVGFSSFTTASKKAVDPIAYVYQGGGSSDAGNWLATTPDGCTEAKEEFCAIEFDDTFLSLPNAVAAIQGHLNDAFVDVPVSGHPDVRVTISTKDADEQK